VLVNTTHPALEDTEIAFNGIGRHIAARIFLARVIDGLMRPDHRANELIEFAFVGTVLISCVECHAQAIYTRALELIGKYHGR
jgi:hypothetical protein